MELYQELLSHMLSRHKMEITFPDNQSSLAEIVTEQSYRALKAIKAIIDDDSLDDETCFYRIEEIICVFEELGSTCGGRHDFG